MIARLALVTVLAACARPDEVYLCERSEQCRVGEEAGFCEASGFCSFSDPGCQTGRRYGDLAGGALAGGCVPLPRCGDGIVRSVVEECDDGNDDDEDGCTRACLACSDPADARFAWAGNGHCYTRHEVATDRVGAHDACEAQGAYLSAHETEAENAAVAAALGGAGQAWFGLTSPTQWENGALVQYTRWGAGCPGAGSTYAIDPAGTWCDADGPLPYLCEHEPGWVVREADGHAYHLGAWLTNQPVAAAECAALGAHLVDIETSEEQVFVASLVRYGAWIGAEATATPGEFLWSSNAPLGYTNWGFDEPMGSADEPCVFIYEAGDWRDVPCDSQYFPLCEREL